MISSAYKFLCRFNILIIMPCLLSVTGCEHWHSDFGMVKAPNLMTELDEDGDYSEIFRQGYREGCESGYSGYASSFNKLFFTWKQDPYLAQDPVYYQIWKDAYAYCALYGMMTDEHGLGNWR